MTKREAITEMIKGTKITHQNFSSEEWVSINGKMEDSSELKYIFENGIECSEMEFWRCRLEDMWDNGWEIWNVTNDNNN